MTFSNGHGRGARSRHDAAADMAARAKYSYHVKRVHIECPRKIICARMKTCSLPGPQAIRETWPDLRCCASEHNRGPDDVVLDG